MVNRRQHPSEGRTPGETHCPGTGNRHSGTEMHKAHEQFHSYPTTVTKGAQNAIQAGHFNKLIEELLQKIPNKTRPSKPMDVIKTRITEDKKVFTGVRGLFPIDAKMEDIIDALSEEIRKELLKRRGYLFQREL